MIDNGAIKVQCDLRFLQSRWLLKWDIKGDADRYISVG